jgi:hypothetical protein
MVAGTKPRHGTDDDETITLVRAALASLKKP